MAQRVIIPRMGQTMTEGVVAKFYKRDGEPVAVGEDVYELEYDKSTATVQAKKAGTIRLLVQEGDTVPLGEAVAVILEDGETLDSVSVSGAYQVASSGTAGAARQAAPAAAAPAAPAHAGGKISASPMVKRLAAEMGIDLAKVTPAGADGRITKEDLEKYKASEAAPKRISASPMVKRLAAEMGIDLKAVTPASPDGRITKEDLEAFKAADQGGAYPANPLARKLAAELDVDLADVAPADGRRITSADVKAAASAVVPPVPDFLPKVKRTEPLSGMRKVIGQRMSESYFTYPTVTLTTDADMGELMALRKKLNAEYEKDGVKLTITDLLLKAVAKALKDNEIINTSLQDGKIIYYEDVNIGLAVALDKGLVVPVVRHADKLTLKELSRETKRLSGLAKSGQLAGDDMKGSTFSVTNLGTKGIDCFNPIINEPESAILGVGRTVEKPWVVDGQITIRPRAVFSITHDHRVIDGVPAADFLKSVVTYVENPASLLD